MPDINKMAPRSGRVMKEDGTVINIADAGLPVQLMGSYVGYSYEDKSTIVPNPQRGFEFYEIDTGTSYAYDGSGWVVLPI